MKTNKPCMECGLSSLGHMVYQTESGEIVIVCSNCLTEAIDKHLVDVFEKYNAKKEGEEK